MFHQSITIPNSDALIDCEPIPGHLGYFADKLGNIYSNKTGKLHKLSPSVNSSNGYLKVMCHINGERLNRYVHHLVALAFIGERPPGLLVCHTPDPSKSNNRADNLRYQTRLENAADMKRDGVRPGAGRKLNYEKAEAIRALHDAGTSTAQIARDFSVSTDCIQKVISWRTWRGQREVKS